MHDFAADAAWGLMPWRQCIDVNHATSLSCHMMFLPRTESSETMAIAWFARQCTWEPVTRSKSLVKVSNVILQDQAYMCIYVSRGMCLYG